MKLNKKQLKREAKEAKKVEKEKKKKIRQYAEKKLRKEVSNIIYWQSGNRVDFSKHKLRMIEPNRYELNSSSPTVVADILEDEFGNIRTLIIEPEEKPKEENLLNKLAQNCKHLNKKQIHGYIERKNIEIENAKPYPKLYEDLRHSNFQDFAYRFKHNFSEEDIIEVLSS